MVCGTGVGFGATTGVVDAAVMVAVAAASARSAGRGEGVGADLAAVVDGDRFRLMRGRSGRRHVFSRVEGRIDAADLAGAVVAIGVGADAAPLWVGEAERAPFGRFGASAVVHAHFLAETAEARRTVIADLTAGDGSARVRRLG
jgi:hypothetical protein